MKACEANIARARAFFEFFDKGRKRGRPRKNDRELLRGSLVFAVGALDAYLHDLILEIVPTRAIQSAELHVAMTAIAKKEPQLALQVATVPHAERAEVLRAALDRHLENQSFYGPKKVMRALGFVGCRLTWPDFDKVTSVNTADELQTATDLRHQIVHRGTSTSLTRDDAECVTKLVEASAKLIDHDIVNGNR